VNNTKLKRKKAKEGPICGGASFEPILTGGRVEEKGCIGPKKDRSKRSKWEESFKTQ